VIGVVGDVRHTRLTSEPDPEVFWPYRSDAWSTVSVVVRSQDPQTTLAQIRPAVGALDAKLPIVALARVSDIIAATRGPAAFSATAAMLFGGLAVALSAFGTFAVLSLLVGHRTREIGIRFALGATRARVRRLVLRDALIPAGAGCLAGLILAAWLARTLATHVYGVDPYSPWIFLTAVAMLATMAGLATWLPVRRAMRVDPAITLRADA
jgi:putative ABC transport system permease protein